MDLRDDDDIETDAGTEDELNGPASSSWPSHFVYYKSSGSVSCLLHLISSGVISPHPIIPELLMLVQDL